MSDRKRRSSAIELQTRCVFCNGRPLTQEHIWSDWLTKILPGMEKHTLFNVHSQMLPNNAVFIQPEMISRQGSLAQRKVRRVCEACNTQWMSRLVSRTKLFVELMVLEKPVVISPDDQRDLATWIAISTIMAEFTDLKNIRVPPSDAAALWQNQEPPDSWTIFIGRYAGEAWAPVRWRHLGQGYQKIVGGRRYDWQATTYTLGAFVAHAFSSTDAIEVLRFRKLWSPLPMIRIWPVTADTADLSWPASPVLMDEAMMEISDGFHNNFLSRNLRYSRVS